MGFIEVTLFSKTTPFSRKRHRKTRKLLCSILWKNTILYLYYIVTIGYILRILQSNTLSGLLLYLGISEPNALLILAGWRVLTSLLMFVSRSSKFRVFFQGIEQSKFRIFRCPFQEKGILLEKKVTSMTPIKSKSTYWGLFSDLFVKC